MIQSTDIKLESSRLYIRPLTCDQLVKYMNMDDEMEKELGLRVRKRELSEEFRSTIEKYLLPYINQYPEHILYATIWIMVNKATNIIVGDIGFNAAPSVKGVIEVGYSTYPEFFNNGYMTEALGSLISWAFKQPEVRIIIAQTDKGNFATHRVLQKNSFEIFAEANTDYWWRLDR